MGFGMVESTVADTGLTSVPATKMSKFSSFLSRWSTAIALASSFPVGPPNALLHNSSP